jgi:hypothetical protein
MGTTFQGTQISTFLSPIDLLIVCGHSLDINKIILSYLKIISNNLNFFLESEKKVLYQDSIYRIKQTVFSDSSAGPDIL